MSAGRVGRPHGRDGSFYVDAPDHSLEVGAEVTVAGRERRIERRGGTGARPLVRLSGVDDREAAAAIGGEALVVDDELSRGEWLASDLVGCRVAGLGTVRRVLEAPSCAVLELEDGFLLPLVADAIRSVDPSSGVIEVDLAFLGVES